MSYDKITQRAYVLKILHDRRDKWLLSNGPCKRCGSWENLEIDHIDPTMKDPKLRSSSGTLWSWSEKRREAELAKCQPLCKDCHKAKTGEDAERQKIERASVHGSRQGYYYGCRCDACREAEMLRRRLWYEAHGGRKNYRQFVAKV